MSVKITYDESNNKRTSLLIFLIDERVQQPSRLEFTEDKLEAHSTNSSNAPNAKTVSAVR